MLRPAVFLGVLVAMAAWELAAPRRRQEIPRVLRWTNNLALVVVDTIILRLTFPILAVGLAQMAEARGWGLFNALDLPLWLTGLLSILLLDLIWQSICSMCCSTRFPDYGGCSGCTTPIWSLM